MREGRRERDRAVSAVRAVSGEGGKEGERQSRECCQSREW